MNSLMLSEQGWQLAGWTMIYFLALGSLVAIIAGSIRLLMRSAPPSFRYATSLGVFALLALLPAGIAFWLVQSKAAVLPIAAPEPVAPPAVIDLALEPTIYSPPVSAIPSVAPLQPVEAVVAATSLLWLADQGIEHLPWLWLIGTPVTFILLATGLVGAERLRRCSRPLVDGAAAEALERMRTTLRIGRQVALAISDRVVSPLLVGIVRPLILLPPAALTGWSPEDLEMVLLHELAHVKRWDNLVNLVQRIVESVLFFHPAVWLMSHWVRMDREDCCDAVVVARTAKPQAYAELLVALASSSQPLAGLALARHPLGGRIRRILRLPEEPMRVSRGTLAAVGIALLAVVLAVNLSNPPSSSAEEKSATTQDELSASEQELIQKKMAQAMHLEAEAKLQAQAAAKQAEAQLAAARAELERLHSEHKKHLETMQQHVLMLKEQRERATLEPELLQPDDTVMLEVMWPYERRGTIDANAGHFADDALTKKYRIESMGTIALGPIYGRIKIAEKDLLEAEQLLTEYLTEKSENSTPPRVQLSLVSKAARPHADPAPLQGVFHSPTGPVDIQPHPLAKVGAGTLIIRDGKMLEGPPTAGEIAQRHQELANELKQLAGELESATRELRESYGSNVPGQLEEAQEKHDMRVAKIRQAMIAVQDEQQRMLARSIPDVLQPVDNPDILQPGDRVVLRVKGALPDEPLSDEFEIESMGTIALGPTYGRVKIAGFNVLDAEEVVKQHLSEILEKPLVQLTLKQKRSQSFGGERPVPIMAPMPPFGVTAPVPTAAPTPAGATIPAPVPKPEPAEIPDPGPVPDARPPQAPPAPAGATVSGEDDLFGSAPKAPHAVTYGAAHVVAAPTAFGGERQVLYDGKTFEEWRDAWKNELKTENRIECIKALAAFGRAGRGKEAVEAIMDVAEQYDFRRSGKMEADLLNAIIGAFYHTIPAKNWLPMVHAKYGADPQKWTGLALRTVPKINDPDMREEQIALLMRIVSEDRSAGSDPLIALISLDRNLKDERIAGLVQQVLNSSELDAQKHAVRALGSAETFPPDFVLLSLKGPEEIKREIRAVLDRTSGSNATTQLLPQLLAELESPAKKEHYLDIIRNIAALGSGASSARDTLEKFLHQDDQQLQVAAAVALERIGLGSSSAMNRLLMIQQSRGGKLDDQEVADKVHMEKQALLPR